MIASYRHGFIFIKTRKTAGTSIELALSEHVTDPVDIVTPVAPEDEALRPADSPPRNHERSARRRWLSTSAVGQLSRGRRPTTHRFVNHSSAAHVAAELPEEWASFFTFAFVRNPWDYAVSRYFWEVHRQDDPALTMDEVLAEWDPAQNWNQITIDGEVAVDFVGRFESLMDDLAIALARVDLPCPQTLPRAKAGTGRKGHYRDVLEPRHAEFIAERCAAEIAHFGYEF